MCQVKISAKAKFWVYMLECSNHHYYTGYTNQLEKRYQSHLNGSAQCKYTRSFKPLKMVQAWEIKADKKLALKLERHIKSLSRQQKQYLVLNPHTLSNEDGVTALSSSDIFNVMTIAT